MMVPSAEIQKKFKIPKNVMQEAFGPASNFRRSLSDIMTPIWDLCKTNGMWMPYQRVLWRRAGFEVDQRG